MTALHRRGHRLTLVARITDAERRHLPAVKAICDAVYTTPHHSSLPGPRLWAFLRSYAALRSALQQALADRRPDLLHVEVLQTAVAALGLRRPPASFRTQDVNWFLAEQRLARATGLRRWKARMARGFWRWFEPWVCRHYDLILAISEGDRRLLARALPDDASRRLLLLPLTPAVRAGADQEVKAGSDSSDLLFVGAMSRDHNIAGVSWFLDEIWPRIRAAEPAVRFNIVGGDPPEALRERAAADSRVNVTGFVEDLAPWYRRAAIFVSPLLVAGGLLQKVMDAMATGTPVVATPVCNHGVGAVPGEHLVTAADAGGFADAVVALLRDSQTRQRIGLAGRTFVEAHYDLEAAVDRWERAFLALCKV
jgi:glycosyltransferase involved in cell wall biosynthesis